MSVARLVGRLAAVVAFAGSLVAVVSSPAAAFVRDVQCSPYMGVSAIHVCVEGYSEARGANPPCWCVDAYLESGAPPSAPVSIGDITVVLQQCGGSGCGTLASVHSWQTDGYRQVPGHSYVARASWTDLVSGERFVSVSSGPMAVPCPC